MRQSHGDRTMIVRPPYSVSMFQSAGVSVLCCILFYRFEVPSQLKMSSCTRLVHEFQKIHEITQPPYDLGTASVWKPQGCVRYPCDFYAWLRRQQNDHTISVQPVYGYAPVRCRNLSKKSHDDRINVNT